MQSSMAALKERLLPSRSQSFDETSDTEAQMGDSGITSIKTRLESKRRRHLQYVSTFAGILCIAGLFYIFALDRIQGWAGNIESVSEPDTFSTESPSQDLVRTDSTHVRVNVPATLPKAQQLLRPIENRLPASILNEYYTRGGLPHVPPQIPVPPVDMVYLWVNASGPYFLDARQDRAEAEKLKISAGDGKRYRDNGELRGAIRSAADSLSGLGTVHVVSGDYPVADLAIAQSQEVKREEKEDSQEEVEKSSWRMGQIPYWLRWETVANGLSGVRWHFHSSIFRLPVDHEHDSEQTKKDLAQTEKAWRAESDPSFNSFAIESRIGWIDDLAENL